MPPELVKVRAKGQTYAVSPGLMSGKTRARRNRAAAMKAAHAEAVSAFRAVPDEAAGIEAARAILRAHGEADHAADNAERMESPYASRHEGCRDWPDLPPCVVCLRNGATMIFAVG